MLEQDKQVFLYFVERNVDPSKIDLDQYKKVQEFKKKYTDKGVYTVKLGENTEQVTMDGLLYGEGDGGFPGGMHDFGERRGVKPPQPQDFH